MNKPLIAVFVLFLSTMAYTQSATTVDGHAQIAPGDLVKIISSTRPLIFFVGPKTLYTQARIPGAEYIGMAAYPEGIQALQMRVEKLPKTRSIVIYCGCCPWDKCPNVGPAHHLLTGLGFKDVKVVHIAENFGTDWVSKGLPTQKGEPAPAPAK
jgi:thiosulfate/3-mercaptopyruvate sulfurtransferase